MTIRRFVPGLTILVVLGGASPALAEDFDFQAQDHDSCIVNMTGDVNMSGTITSSDILCVVIHVFLGPCQPEPCPNAGDVNCTGTVTSADVIYLVNHVFKGGPEPCDVCENSPPNSLYLSCYD